MAWFLTVMMMVVAVVVVVVVVVVAVTTAVVVVSGHTRHRLITFLMARSLRRSAIPCATGKHWGTVVLSDTHTCARTYTHMRSRYSQGSGFGRALATNG